VLAELPGPNVLRSSSELVAYAGLNPRLHQSETSINRITSISKIGNAVLRSALYMPALSPMRYNRVIVALVTRLKAQGRLKPKQIVVAAMRRLLVLCYSPNVRWAFEGGAQGWGLNNSQYSRMCDASTPSVLLRPNLVRAKSRICGGLTMLTTWPASCSAHAMPRLKRPVDSRQA
jgi:Transposase IS116/IS110/IS902 family